MCSPDSRLACLGGLKTLNWREFAGLSTNFDPLFFAFFLEHTFWQNNVKMRRVLNIPHWLLPSAKVWLMCPWWAITAFCLFKARSSTPVGAILLHPLASIYLFPSHSDSFFFFFGLLYHVHRMQASHSMYSEFSFFNHPDPQSLDICFTQWTVMKCLITSEIL